VLWGGIGGGCWGVGGGGGGGGGGIIFRLTEYESTEKSENTAFPASIKPR